MTLRYFHQRLLFALLWVALAGALPAFGQPSAPQEPPAGRFDAKKAKKAFQKAREAEQARDWQAAFEYYGEAVAWWPGQAEYLAGRELARFRLVERHVERAELEVLAGRREQARREFQAALALDPNYSVAQERLAQLEPVVVREAEQLPEYAAGPVELQTQPGTRDFDYRGETRGAYEEVAKRFGVRAVFDEDLRAREIRFRVSGVDFATAMRLLGQQTSTFWRALDERTFFVVNDNPQKRKEYEPVVVRSVLLPDSTTPERMTEITRVVREITGIEHTQLDSRSRTITLRDTPATVALAVQLIQELEQATGELMLEIEILDVDRVQARKLGITPPSSGRLVTITPQDIQEAQQSTEALLRVIARLFGLPTSLAGLTPEQISGLIGGGQLGQLALIPPLVAFGGGRTVFLATLPGAAADFAETVSALRRARRMMLRAENGRPATFFVGERFPINLAVLTPSFFSPELAPLIGTGQFQTPYPAFQYEDLGVKVRATPRLHQENDVTLELEFEIRTLSAQELNGIPVISSRNVTQTVRLRENEPAVLAGIIQREERLGLTGWPGFSRLAGAGYLTGRRDKQERESELLIVITPRLLRLAPRAGRSIYAGREARSTSGRP